MSTRRCSVSVPVRRLRNRSEGGPNFAQLGPSPVEIAQIWPKPADSGRFRNIASPFNQNELQNGRHLSSCDLALGVDMKTRFSRQ